MERSYRIHTNIINDTVLNVNMNQDYDFLEVLSLKLRQKDAYKLHSSNYGVIVGRVLANDAFGIPNARLSVFIERDTNDNIQLETLYPYSSIDSKDKNGRRYNLLPDDSDDECYRIVGTFPNKRLVLDNDTVLEIYDKYYKYTTVTNKAGDYMIFGVPSGSQQIHVDIDLSDIGMLSQKPRDFEYKGYTSTMFDNPNQFKESTNLDNLAQIFSQNKSAFVYPFWGDADNGVAAITRCDIQIQYKFEPTCVFMGSIISDNEGNSIGHKCAPTVDNGMNSQLIAGEGTIEMIRKTTDGLVEEFSINGNQLIDSNGVWCYQIPMNLDFIGTDEYGNIVPTDDPSKGIPTRAQVRFRISKTETGNEGHSRHTAKYLVPMNPPLVGGAPQSVENGQNIEQMYKFGSETPLSCFRDLYWNNVYSVKNYIPKIQVAHRAYSPNYSALKGSNLVENQNPVPFNKLRIDLPFMYVIVCLIYDVLIYAVTGINSVIAIINGILGIFYEIANFCIRIPVIRVSICPFGWLRHLLPGYIGCVSLGCGLSEDNTVWYPGCCMINHTGLNHSNCPRECQNCHKRCGELDELRDLVQRKLASDYKIIKLDFYQDWVNGVLYMPLWYWRKSKKQSYFFGLFSRSAKNEYCSCDSTYSRLKSYITCVFKYTNNELGVNDTVLAEGEEYWHRNRSSAISFPNGVIKSVENRDGLKAYYYTAIQATAANSIYQPMIERPSRFYAVRLYATDIILLGNLNDNNLYGIPQVFNALPSTTANIPPIASVRDGADTEGGAPPTNETFEDGSVGESLVTGMDWGHDGGSQRPLYREGLFMDLECTRAKTKAKSCINVERLSELGMNPDMAFGMEYSKNGLLNVGFLDSDGFVSKYELDDTENRAMFATMNHLGFTPQAYQDTLSVGGYATQVQDKNTNYWIPKFKYIYPVDLDGRMNPIMGRYKNGFPQAMADNKDSSYIDFRFGESRMLYNGNMIPLYNNSFYFYFGVNKGNTAIEKFRDMFVAQCFQNRVIPFTLKIDKRGESYCKKIYEGRGSDEYGIPYGEPYIRFTVDDIQKPYSYVLRTISGEEIKSGEDITDDMVIIHGDALNNQSYDLIVMDNNGRTVKERVILSMDNITMDYDARGLGTKYYDMVSGSTEDDNQMKKICLDETEYYGLITVKNIIIDSYEFYITNISLLGVEPSGDIYNKATFSVECKDYDNLFNVGNAIIEVTYGDVDGNGKLLPLEPCLCREVEYGEHDWQQSGGTIIEHTVDWKDINLGDGRHQLDVKVYKPTIFNVSITQVCNGEVLSSNTSTVSVNIENGEEFHAYLNGVPLNFLVGNGRAFKFYNPSTVMTQAEYMTGWTNTHNEKVYNFPSIDSGNTEIWNDFVDVTENITTSRDKNKIIEYKFAKLFDLSKAVYSTNEGNNKFEFTATGGVQPILYRSILPYYGDDEKIGRYVKYSELNTVSLDERFPNIKYNSDFSQGAIINQDICESGTSLNGNYFAAFTNNGGYRDNYTQLCKYRILTAPQGAAVNVQKPYTKEIGFEAELDKIPYLTYESGFDSCGRSTNAHFRAMFVDRRLDYDLRIISPYSYTSEDLVAGQTISLTDEALLKSPRIFGTLYNGVEMSYDDDDNIISSKIITYNVPKQVQGLSKIIESRQIPNLTPRRDATTLEMWVDDFPSWLTNSYVMDEANSPCEYGAAHFIHHVGDTAETVEYSGQTCYVWNTVGDCGENEGGTQYHWYLYTTTEDINTLKLDSIKDNNYNRDTVFNSLVVAIYPGVGPDSQVEYTKDGEYRLVSVEQCIVKDSSGHVIYDSVSYEDVDDGGVTIQPSGYHPIDEYLKSSGDSNVYYSNGAWAYSSETYNTQEGYEFYFKMLKPNLVPMRYGDGSIVYVNQDVVYEELFVFGDELEEVYDLNGESITTTAYTNNGGQMDVIMVDEPDSDGRAEEDYSLEYTYNTDSGITIWTHDTINQSSEEPPYVWRGYNSDGLIKMCEARYGLSAGTSEDSYPQGTRMPIYSRSAVNDIDTRLMFWSTFNCINLNEYCDTSGNTLDFDENEGAWVSDSELYLYKLPSTDYGEKYNSIYYYDGDINTYKSYPTKRYFDALLKARFDDDKKLVENLEFNFNVTTCSYDTSVSKDELNLIKSYQNPKDPDLNIQLRFGTTTQNTLTIKPAPVQNYFFEFTQTRVTPERPHEQKTDKWWQYGCDGQHEGFCRGVFIGFSGECSNYVNYDFDTVYISCPRAITYRNLLNSKKGPDNLDWDALFNYENTNTTVTATSVPRTSDAEREVLEITKDCYFKYYDTDNVKEPILKSDDAEFGEIKMNLTCRLATSDYFTFVVKREYLHSTSNQGLMEKLITYEFPTKWFNAPNNMSSFKVTYTVTSADGEFGHRKYEVNVLLYSLVNFVIDGDVTSYPTGGAKFKYEITGQEMFVSATWQSGNIQVYSTSPNYGFIMHFEDPWPESHVSYLTSYLTGLSFTLRAWNEGQLVPVLVSLF